MAYKTQGNLCLHLMVYYIIKDTVTDTDEEPGGEIRRVWVEGA